MNIDQRFPNPKPRVIKVNTPTIQDVRTETVRNGNGTFTAVTQLPPRPKPVIFKPVRMQSEQD